MIEVKEIKTRKDLRLFATYPVKLYKNCKYYVPSIRGDEMSTFNPKKNFSLSCCDAKGFLCYKDGKLVGRIAGIINKAYNEKVNKKYVRFSRFECIDDLEVFKALLSAVENYGKENGMEIMHGPWGFNDTDREGMLSYGFDERSTYATNYYYPYFWENMKKLGFDDESKWIEKRFVIPDKPYERVIEIGEKLKKRLNLTDVMEKMSIKQMVKKYGDSLFDVYNESYRHLDGFIPAEGKMKENILSQFGTICNKRFVSVLVDNNDRVVAFGVILPSICDPLIKHRGKLLFALPGILKSVKNPKDLEMALVGVLDEYKNSGVNAIFMASLMKHILEDGVTNVETNPMLETNDSIQQMWKWFETEIVKKRQTFIKEIGKPYAKAQ